MAQLITLESQKELERICPGGLSANEALAGLSRWRIGGQADLVLRPSSTQELAALLRYFDARGVTPLVFGATSNLLFADDGVRVPCIAIGARMAGLRVDGATVQAQAGLWVPCLARRVMQAGLSGIEHTVGIPGSLGGLIYMNGGSQRKGIGTHVTHVESVTPSGEIRLRPGSDCGFRYRHSAFHELAEVISGVTLRLSPGDPAAIRSEMLSILVSRSRKFPRKLPSGGSTFTSDAVLYPDHGPPGAIIEGLGFKGQRIGGIEVSPRHANFLVNTGGARATDVLDMISRINRAVFAKTGRAMLAEVRYVYPDGRTAPASEVAAERAGLA